jgi:AraC-like DNA-binding protein
VGDLLVDDATVAGIAFRWGFTNLGRFARDYQDLSGETPSMTRRQPTL